MQLTDSAYVAHSEDILYRQAYEGFRRAGQTDDFFKIVHTAGKLDENGASAEVDKRRVYIDLNDNTVYSTNTQYAGNTVGLKKLSLRLAINKASREGWLAEHMLVMGVHGPGGRISYFTGAYPSACGKTSTAMLPGESIVGDDIAYLRPIYGELRAANVEAGIFGIIQDVNKDDDPIIWNVLHDPGEIIFSNVLIKDGKPYWLGMGEETPDEGYNHSGKWWAGKKDDEGREITLSHKNARYTVSLSQLENRDPRLNDPEGVPVAGVIYGGRDSDTSVPVEQAFDWTHGIITKGASLESETTSATLGKEGVRVFQPMSNLDFVSLPLGKYIRNNLDIVEKVDSPPLIFSVNYFLRGKDGQFLNDIQDKLVWLKWMELRVHGEVDAIERPTGLIPEYEDLKRLFKEFRGKDYAREEYDEQFALRIPENLAKIDRIEKIYRESVSDAPDILFEVLDEQRKRLEAAK
jgi:phosphoenolpyruvate carboxykinase (GTP)